MSNRANNENQILLPRHIAVIMDGNGRWAKARGLPRVAGHHKGAEAVHTIVESCARMGVECLTLYSFSSENWNRPLEEIRSLMALLRRYLQSEIAEIHAKNIRFRVIGDRAHIADDIVRMIGEAENLTQNNNRMTLVLALSYGGRQELTEAARKIAKSAELGLITPDALDEDFFAGYLNTAGMPDPDLLIRTSGEQRISNFMLWQLAYAELYFCDKYWPDFGESDLLKAIEEYQKRDRRFGATNSNIK